MNRVATGKSAQDTSDLFIHRRGDLASIGESVIEQIEDVTVIDISTEVGAFRDSFLKKGYIPTIQEISVQAKSSIITLRKHKWLPGTIPVVLESIGVEDDFVEQGDEAFGEFLRTFAIIIDRWIGHVGLVIWRVEIFAIPTRRKEDLSPKPIGAVLGGEAVGFWTRCSEAIVTYGLLFKRIGVITQERVACQHAKTFWECKKTWLRIIFVFPLPSPIVSRVA